MEPQAGLIVIYGILNVVLVLFTAPFFEGVLRKVTAQVQSRKGPPVLQPYFHLLKLLGKEDIEVGENPTMQRFAAYLSLAAILTVATLVPMGTGIAMNRAGDIILLIYLLTLCGIATLFAGMAAGSLYSLVGMSREMMAMMTLEPLLAVGLVIASIHAGSLRLDAVLNGAIYGTGANWWNHSVDWAVFPVDWVNMPVLSQHITHGPMVAAVYIPRKALRVGVSYREDLHHLTSPVLLVRVKPRHALFSF